MVRPRRYYEKPVRRFKYMVAVCFDAHLIPYVQMAGRAKENCRRGSLTYRFVYLPSGKLTNIGLNITMANGKISYKWPIFNSYVSYTSIYCPA